MLESILGYTILTCDHCGYELPFIFETRDEAIAARKESGWERKMVGPSLEDWCLNCCAEKEEKGK